MKTRLTFTLLVLISVNFFSYSKTSFDKAAFYTAISNNSLEKVNDQIKILEESSIAEKVGYEGALLMKKAGLVASLLHKLNLFKEGHEKLEEAIREDPANTEFRFLRLIIQENAPSILNYNNEMEKDITHIKNTFGSLPTLVQKVIVDYSKESKILNI